MKGDEMHLIVIVYPWARPCYYGNWNAKIEPESIHASRCVKTTQEVSHCENADSNEYPGTKAYP